MHVYNNLSNYNKNVFVGNNKLSQGNFACYKSFNTIKNIKFLNSSEHHVAYLNINVIVGLFYRLTHHVLD